MEFSVNRSFFLEKITNASYAISPNSPSPAYGGILIYVHPDHLTLTAQDSTTAIVIEVYEGELNQLSISETGHAIVEAHYLIEIIRRMSGERIHLVSVGDNMVQVNDDTGKFNLVTLPMDRYQLPDIKKPETEMTVSLENIRKTIEQVSYCASVKDARTVLQGVNFRTQDSSIVTACTDSYRMAMNTIDAEFDQEFNITIPVRVLQDVLKIFKNNEEQIHVYLNRRKIQFVAEKTLIQSVLYDGTFPNVIAIVPKNFKSVMEVDAPMLIPYLERTVLFKIQGVPEVRFALDEKGIQIRSRSEEIGNADQEFYEFFYEGDPMNLSLNGQYLLDAIKALKTSGKIRMEFTGELSPIKITDPENSSLIMIVVPMRSSY